MNCLRTGMLTAPSGIVELQPLYNFWQLSYVGVEIDLYNVVFKVDIE